MDRLQPNPWDDTRREAGMQWIFETLDIEAGADASAIRKAYARAIKQCDQATEAERFQRIRQAYELAMQWVTQRTIVAQAVPDVDQRQSADISGHADPADSAGEVTPPATASTQHIHTLWDEFIETCRHSDDSAIGDVLRMYADDARLTSLDAKAEFEQAVLTLAFTAPVNIALLDAACDLFAWETSNRHLAAVRPDLVFRLHRHQAFRHLLRHNKYRDEWHLAEAQKAHSLKPSVRPPSWQVSKVNKVLDRYAAFKRELDERFGSNMVDWWREQKNKKEAPAVPVGHGVASSMKDKEAFGDLWEEFLEALRGTGEETVHRILRTYAEDARLVSLDAKADFEQAILVLAFASRNIALLDVACDQFAWETSNRHLKARRPDLVLRMLRHQSLRMLLKNGMSGDVSNLSDAARIYRRREHKHLKLDFAQISHINRVLDRHAEFKLELDERFAPGMFDWWKQQWAKHVEHIAALPTPEKKPTKNRLVIPDALSALISFVRPFLVMWAIVIVIVMSLWWAYRAASF